jgi:hypothetical protein
VRHGDLRAKLATGVCPRYAAYPLRGNFGNCTQWRDLNLFGQARL